MAVSAEHQRSPLKQEHRPHRTAYHSSHHGQVLPSALQLSCKAGTEGMSRERIYLDIPHTVRQNAFMSHSEMITC